MSDRTITISAETAAELRRYLNFTKGYAKHKTGVAAKAFITAVDAEPPRPPYQLGDYVEISIPHCFGILAEHASLGFFRVKTCEGDILSMPEDIARIIHRPEKRE